jgi:hypothetical protein
MTELQGWVATIGPLVAIGVMIWRMSGGFTSLTTKIEYFGKKLEDVVVQNKIDHEVIREQQVNNGEVIRRQGEEIAGLRGVVEAWRDDR